MLAKRLILGNFIFVSIAVACLIAIMVPFRVADCGPPDPYLIRYLGAPFFSGTGHSIGSSLESSFWAVPLLANIILLSAILCAAFWGVGKLWPWQANQMQAILSFVPGGLAVFWIALMGYFVVTANDLHLTGALPGPDRPMSTCTVSWQIAPDTRGLQSAP